MSVMGFTIASGAIVAIDILADPERLTRISVDDPVSSRE